MNSRTTFLAGSFALGLIAAPALAQTESRPRAEAHAAAPSPARPRQGVRIGIMTPQPQTPRALPPIPTTGFVTNYTNPPGTYPSGYSSYGVFNAPSYGSPAVQGQVIYSAPQVAQVTYLPTLVLTDGRIFANFGTGHGYEQVLRKCPQLSGQASWNMIIPPCWGLDQSGHYYVMQQR